MAPSNLELDQTAARHPFLYIYATFMNCPHSNTRAQTLAPTLILIGDALSPPCAPSPRSTPRSTPLSGNLAPLAIFNSVQHRSPAACQPDVPDLGICFHLDSLSHSSLPLVSPRSPRYGIAARVDRDVHLPAGRSLTHDLPSLASRLGCPQSIENTRRAWNSERHAVKRH
jgi:hypothetical protein